MTFLVDLILILYYAFSLAVSFVVVGILKLFLLYYVDYCFSYLIVLEKLHI